MKVIVSVIILALWSYMIYKGVKVAKERRAHRYSKFFKGAAESINFEDNDDVEVEEKI